MVGNWGILNGDLTALTVWIAATVYASKLAKRKHRSAAWPVAVLVFIPALLVLFLVPSRAVAERGAVEEPASLMHLPRPLVPATMRRDLSMAHELDLSGLIVRQNGTEDHRH
jgi:hypothetical protein